jgi:hypothetical protein
MPVIAKHPPGQAAGGPVIAIPPILAVDSATRFEPRHRDAVVICGSYGGRYPAYLAAKARLRAVILNDASVGFERAGIAGLDDCQAIGMAAASIAYDSARIGDSTDMRQRGVISHANATARQVGCLPGQGAEDAARALTAAPAWQDEPPPHREGRTLLIDLPGKPRVVCIDSASMVQREDAGQIVITGSHGGLLGGDPAAALGVDALFAIFHDAGIGIDEAGIGRLPALDARSIAAMTVDSRTARIGDALSTYQTGVISRANQTAAAKGIGPGVALKDVVERLLAG